METGTLVIAALAAVSIVMIAVGIAMAGNSGVTLERLDRYAATARTTDGPALGGQGISDLVPRSAPLAQLNKVVEKRDLGANLLRDLGAADLKIKPSEWLAIWGGATIGVPVLFMALSIVLPAFQNPLLILFGGIIGFMVPRFWLNHRKSSRLKA